MPGDPWQAVGPHGAGCGQGPAELKWLRIGWVVLARPAGVFRVAAQVARSASEVVAYVELNAAAHRRDVTAIAAAGKHVADRARRARRERANAAARGLIARPREAIAAVADEEQTLCVPLDHDASARLVTSRCEDAALVAAAHLGHDGVVRELMAAGAPLNHVKNRHWTALVEAIVLGDGGLRHQRTAHTLLETGAHAQATDREGRTPLQPAKDCGHEPMVGVLKAAAPR